MAKKTDLIKRPDPTLAPKQEVEIFLSALAYLVVAYRGSVDDALSNMSDEARDRLQAGHLYTKGNDINDIWTAYSGSFFIDCYSNAHSSLSVAPPDQLSRSELAERLEKIFPMNRTAEDDRDNVLEVFDKINAALDSGIAMKGYQRTAAKQPDRVAKPQPQIAFLK